ncbi:D-alanyl-D-alanine carboxypeptidase/D-alanyl-D-alanine endopeptidase [Ruania albidiflava]|uniref:D-alanyl-D-alanine carboxypeptidase/D-alanyl-D-alanine endopeptidase n=1 Tax=Ruania albidiflava TaxID=366586 RepID=UPI0012FBED09|nr:D-alanyl-D-alanine carboxypeptidase/D-alanyl-D-alanine-endopeptidase [Ruania albidiflava]
MAKTAGGGARRPPQRTSTRRRMYRRRRLVAGFLVLLVLGAGYGTLDAFDLAPGVLTRTDPWPEAQPFPSPALPAPVAEAEVPALADDAPLPSGDALAELSQDLLSDDRVGPDPGVMVVDVTTGEALLAQHVGQEYVPASSLKVLVAVAVVASYGDQHRFTTTAVTGGDDQVTLVAGGDLTLAEGAGDPEAIIGHGGLGDLAEQTAAALTEAGTTSVHLNLDDTLFTGPTLAPRWGDVDLSGGWGMHMAPIAVDIGRIDGQQARSTDAAMDAAQIFADHLADAGITVDPQIDRAAAPEEATELGAVQSATLDEIVAYTLQHSENILSEALGRMTAVATGHEASFAGAGEAVLEVLADLGLDTSGAQLVDTSGLSSASKLTPQLLTGALRLTADGSHPELLAVADGMPIAGLEGTLGSRLTDGAATGTLRAKTGTLPQVVALTGLVTTADGRLVAFTVLANDFDRGGAHSARSAVDAWARDLAGCGCS